MQFLHKLIDYVYEDDIHEVRKHVVKQVVKSKDNNKGYLWEQALAKAMKGHTKWLGGNTKGMDFSDGSDAKIAVFYQKKSGLRYVWEASVSGIGNKKGPLRVCLVVPGENYHRLFFMFIPYNAYQEYINGSDALKFGLNSKGVPTSPLFEKFQCDWVQVAKPYTFEPKQLNLL